MKGIVLAGGNGSRLFPITKSTSKQLLCIYDKPMIYYPISMLFMANIKDILIISSPQYIDSYKRLLGCGKSLGVNFEYIIQDKPNGLAEAFLIGKDFIADDNVCMVLGDNIFYGNNIEKILNSAVERLNNFDKAIIFGCYVKNPNRYGVIEFDEKNNIIAIEEKPDSPMSNYVVSGIYFYPNNVIDLVKDIRPSLRGELEITTLNNIYLNKNKLELKILDKGITWLDTGTPDSLLEASNFIQAIEKRQGLKVACLEEIAFKKNYICSNDLNKFIKKYNKSEYGNYLSKLTKN